MLVVPRAVLAGVGLVGWGFGGGLGAMGVGAGAGVGTAGSLLLIGAALYITL